MFDVPEGSWDGVTPTSCRDVLVHEAATQRALPRNADVTRGYAFSVPGLGDVNAIVTVTSFAAPQHGFPELTNSLAACPRLRLPAQRSEVSIHGVLAGNL